MRIAYIANIIESVPPPKYSAIEWITYYIASSMAKKGHHVDLYASGDSQKIEGVNLIPIVERGIRKESWYTTDSKLRDVSILLAMSKAAQLINQQQYDIVHNHTDRVFMYYAKFINHQIITTCHSAFTPSYRSLFYLENKTQPYISISMNQRKDAPELNFIANIYHGIDISFFPYGEHENIEKTYMAFLARMIPEKGAFEAATVAHRIQKPLQLASKKDPLADSIYIEKVKPLMDNKICIDVDELFFNQKGSFLQQAICLLAPIMWEEPFGLMFIESMATGTPVVAFARGSVPEIIKDGETGFIVNPSDDDIRGNWIVKKTGIDGLCEAIERIYALPKEQYTTMRKACRTHVEKNFALKRMIADYENIYRNNAK